MNKLLAFKSAAFIGLGMYNSFLLINYPPGLKFAAMLVSLLCFGLAIYYSQKAVGK